MECKVCLMTDDIAEIKDKVCNFCVLHKTIEKNCVDFNPTLEKIKNYKGRYNCLLGILFIYWGGGGWRRWRRFSSTRGFHLDIFFNHDEIIPSGYLLSIFR